MLSKISMSMLVVIALLFGAIRLPAAPCILSNAPTEKACQSGCCAYKSCCETSHKRTGLPAQPLAKSASDQQNVVSLPALVGIEMLNRTATEIGFFSSAECIAHSPAPLALNCIRLI